VSVFVWLRSSCNFVSAVRCVRLALKIVLENDGDFVDVLVLYKSRNFLDKRRKNIKILTIFLLF
jgi:hypothetical protein